MQFLFLFPFLFSQLLQESPESQNEMCLLVNDVSLTGYIMSAQKTSPWFYYAKPVPLRLGEGQT